ncbi:MAG: hypothetical protein DHS20C21_04690 [Gemmatimonadota bacterium]|nr:MAG: hypothetical protein DHS20C21_04690 [Gemmatimonadota bacterium]
MLKVQLAAVVFCLALLLIIGVQNSEVVELRFLTWTRGISLVALVFLTAAAGLVVGFVLGKLGGRRRTP